MLSDDAYKLLKVFNKKTSLSNEELYKYPDFALDELLKGKYVVANFAIIGVKIKPELSDYYVEDIGKSYLKSARNEKLSSIFHSTASHVIEVIIALVVAYTIFHLGWNK